MLEQDFVQGVIGVANRFTYEHLDHFVSEQWRDREHLYNEIKRHIPEHSYSLYKQHLYQFEDEYYGT